MKNPFRGRAAAEAPLTDGFHQNPLEFLDREFPSSGGMVQTGAKEFCIGDPIAARAVLINQGKLYEEDSDFFTTRIGLFGPREAQLNIRRESRALLRSFLEGHGGEALNSLIKVNLPEVSEWPDTGNRLVYRYLRPLLLAPDSPPKLLRLLDDIVERLILEKSRLRRSAWQRRILQFRVTLLLSEAIEARRAGAMRPQPLDLLDVVARASVQGQDSAESAEVFMSFVFSVAGSIGFVLGWSIYLLGTHPAHEVPPEWVVQEALRLWPVAWRLARRPAKDHQLSGVSVGAAHKIVACPYLVHRNPEYWSDPTEFRPERWAAAESRHNPAFIPFGYGPHQCVAADLSIQLISRMVAAITRENLLSVTSRDTRTTPAAALAPPPYRLILRSRR